MFCIFGDFDNLLNPKDTYETENEGLKIPRCINDRFYDFLPFL